MNLLKKGYYLLLVLLLSITVSCEDNEDGIDTIKGLDFNIATLNYKGNKVGVLPVSAYGNGSIVYTVDFGAVAEDDTDEFRTSGPLVTYNYPKETATYTITVTASLDGVSDVSITKEHTVTYSDVVVDPVDNTGLFDDFEGDGNISWFADGVVLNTELANPVSGGINTSATVLEYNDNGSGQYDNIRFDTATKFDLTTDSKFTLKVYVPSSGLTGSETNQISLKLQDGTAGEPWTTQTEIVKTLVLDEWQEITFDFENDDYKNWEGITETPLERTDLSRVVLQLNGEGNNSEVVAYIDDFSYGTPPAAPFLASDDFEGTDGITSWFADGVVLNTELANPVSGGINTSATVLEYNDNGSGQYANIRFEVAPNFDLTEKSKFTLKVYVPSSGLTGSETNQISLKLQDGTAGEPWTTQTEIVKTLVLDEWQEVTFDFENDDYKNWEGITETPLERTDLSRVVLQLNGEGNNSKVLAYLDDLTYE